MSRKTVVVSDQSGELIDNATKGATITIAFGDARRGNFVADLTADEAQAIVKGMNARQQQRRGRKPKSESAS